MHSPKPPNVKAGTHQLCLSLLLILLAASSAHAQAVYRCVKADQSSVYQAKPCPVGHTQKQMRLQSAPTPVPGERANELSDARQNPQPSQHRTDSPAQVQAQAAPLPPCPRTREDGGSYIIGSTAPDSYDIAIARAHYQALPSRTYLKNAGKWPKHCPP